MNEKKHPPPLPDWIPWGAKGPYFAVYYNGGYSDPKASGALEKLYHSEKLKGLWEGLAKLTIPPDGWSFLIGSIILDTECAPESGKRATRDAPSKKIEIRERQQKADVLMRAAAKKARELVAALDALADNGGESPAEAYSGLALIRTAIDADGMSRACCGEPFAEFERGLSSYNRHEFPHPVAIVDALVQALEEFPEAAALFENDPWLSSRQSSWKDYVRVLRSRFSECRRKYGDAPELTETEWTALLQVLISPDLSRQVVAVGLKDL